MKMGESAAATPLPPEVAVPETTGEIAYNFRCVGDSAEIRMLMAAGLQISWSVRRVCP